MQKRKEKKKNRYKKYWIENLNLKEIKILWTHNYHVFIINLEIENKFCKESCYLIHYLK